MIAHKGDLFDSAIAKGRAASCSQRLLDDADRRPTQVQDRQDARGKGEVHLSAA